MPKTQVLQVEWIHPDSVERWLSKMVMGRTLNICCGMSRVGEVRLDIDPLANRTAEGDLFKLDYGPGTFDTVVCDPPFSYYNKFKWLMRLSLIPRKRLLVSAPPIGLLHFLPRYKARLFAIADQTKPLFLRLYWCFDRKDTLLS